jgi:signal transduction histidine kinase
VAALLTAAAVVVPCSAWYVAGSRAAEERASTLESLPREQARVEALRIAEQLALRLEALRQSESRRPFTDYLGDGQRLFLGECGDDAGGRSPLAQGPADPLIWAHFQIDDVGQLTLPTLGDGEAPPPGARRARQADEIQMAILEELECASSDHLAALRRLPDEAAEQRRVPAGSGVVTVGPFEWHSASLKEQPALVALREVTTPTAVLTQGFVVLAESLEALQASAPFPARVLPGRPNGRDGEARLPVTGDAWTVTLDASEAFAAAGAEAQRRRLGFRRNFVLGSLAALLAGGAIVLLVRQTDRLAEQRARFAAAAAHELRTPLAGLQLYGEMLADGSGDPERRSSYARRIALEAERLGRVVSNVLGFSRLERGRLGASPESGDLGAAVRESLERLRPTLEANGATLATLIDEGLPSARFDRDAVHRILQNLLDNAERYSRASPDRRITVRLTHGPQGHVLSVVDHGPGVAPGLRRSLFRPFSRHQDPDGPAGLGIGLALVKALADAQGAAVLHRPADGGGTDFSVYFPASV